MKAKGVWGWTFAGLVGLASLIGTPIADSLVKEGKLPDWISPKLVGFVSWFSADVPVPVWLFVVVTCCLCWALALFVKFRFGRPADVVASLADATSLLTASQQRNLDLEASNTLLHQQLGQASAALQALQEKKLEVSAQGHKVLAFVASCINYGETANLYSIGQSLKIGQVEAHVFVDELTESGLLEKVSTVHGAKFRLSAKGRSYYVKMKEK